MKFVRYAHAGGPPQWGVVSGDDVHVLSDLPAGEPSYGDLSDRAYLTAVRRSVAADALSTVAEEEVRRLAPVPEPGKIVCVGLNYRDHAEERGKALPEQPLLFSKAPTAVANPSDPIYHHDGVESLDYEAELAVVVGRRLSDADPSTARDRVAGYTALNDVTARRIQSRDGQFYRAKSFDTFAPMGPRLVAGEGFDPDAADVACRVNGETRQASNTSQFIFDLGHLLADISESMTLRPGDVVSTGTPSGVGFHTEPPSVLEPGDDVEVEIEGIGTLENRVVEAP